MPSRLLSLQRLVGLQEKVADLRKNQQLKCQSDLNEITRQSASAAEVLESGGLAWTVFPDLANRFYARIEDEKRIAADAVLRAADAAGREKKALESLQKRHATLAREEFGRRENDARLESMRFTSAASASRKVD
jgi:hypothetical protein